MAYSKIYASGIYPIVCNIPHDSTIIPKQFKEDFSIDNNELKAEAFELADLHTKDLFEPLLKKYNGIVSKISRLVVDIERFDNDNLETMSSVGMGVLYEKSTKGKSIRKLSRARKNQLLHSVYYPYHQNLETLADICLKKFGKCLIIDCHSFPEIARTYEPDQSKRNHDICLGSNHFHTPKIIFDTFKDNFKKGGFKVKQNIPFSGTIVPAKYFNKNKNVYSIMIEVNRKLYMDENNFYKKPGFNDISSKICHNINRSVEDFLKLKLI
jgi:N-formylglutamate amidohydrolase